MEPHEKIFKECMELMEIATLANDSFIDAALNEELTDVNNELYDVYSKAKDVRIKVSEEKFRADTVQYNAELLRAKNFVEAMTQYYTPFITTQDDGHFQFIFFDRKNFRHATYRLYLNIKIFKFTDFIRRLWSTITDKINCPCGGKAKYKSEQKKMICETCNKDNFFFSFKFHVPLKQTEKYISGMENLLRHDKIVMYFPDEESAKAMAITLREHQNLFEPKTMPLTGEIFPGLGFAIEPTEEEKAEYKAATDEERVSFGAFISRLLAEIIIKAFKNKKAQIQMIYKNWKDKYSQFRVGKEYYKERAILFNTIYPLIANDLRNLIAGEEKFKRYFDELAELERLAA